MEDTNVYQKFKTRPLGLKPLPNFRFPLIFVLEGGPTSDKHRSNFSPYLIDCDDIRPLCVQDSIHCEKIHVANTIQQIVNVESIAGSGTKILIREK